MVVIMNDKDKATIEIFRHYGNIRFIMLPMFFTTMGAVVIAYWKLSSGEQQNEGLQQWVAFSGAVISSLFFIYELNLSKALINICSIMPDSFSVIKHTDQFGLLTLITLVLYGAPGVFWFFQFISHL